MMKKAAFLFLVIMMVACSSGARKSAVKPLYEILTRQSDGGANIRFYEILTEAKEIKMLENDENLRKKIKPGDIDTANFVILNVGERISGGYSIKVKSVIETADKILMTVEETEPKTVEMVTEVISYPYVIVKINSKKPIEIQ